LAALDESIFCRLGGLDKNKLEIDQDWDRDSTK
jgi:hypothetical protein